MNVNIQPNANAAVPENNIKTIKQLFGPLFSNFSFDPTKIWATLSEVR